MFTENKLDRADWPLLQNGAINLFWRKELFEEAIERLKALDYRVLRVSFDRMEDFCRDVSLALRWKEQFGYDQWNGNLDALNDGFRYQPFESANDSAFCIENFHALMAKDAYIGAAILDLIARQSRDYMLFGKRLICLIQTDDADFTTEALGGSPALWNRAEWLNSTRDR